MIATNIIQRVSHCRGHTFWVQVYDNLVPRYEVFKVIGHHPTSGTYYFKSVREGSIIGRTVYQFGPSFKPFVITAVPTVQQGSNKHAD